MKQSLNKNTILVLGASGKTGSRISARLLQNGFDVRQGSRSAAIPFDWEKEESWPAVLQNVTAVYLSFQPDLAASDAAEKIRRFKDLAIAAGVQKLVLLSGRGEPEAVLCENIVRASGLQWTILRASWFCQNFSEGYLLEPLLAGHVALPAGNVTEPFIDVEDIADAAVQALTTQGHHQATYELTGPRLLTFKQAVEEISAATGRTIQYQELSLEAYTDLLKSYEVPHEYISLLSYLFSQVLDGRNSTTEKGVEQATGHPARDFSEYVQRTAASGVWNSILI